MPDAPRAAAIVLAAGRSTRMGSDKLTAILGDVPVLTRTLRAFEECDAIGGIVLVGPPGLTAFTVGLTRLIAIAAGGDRRRDSVAAGLEALDGTWNVVAVHDGARPLVDPDLIARGVALAHERGSAVPVVPLADTVKRVDGNGRVVETPPRASLRAAQTPQCFRVELLRRAHAASDDDATDDAVLVERLGEPVWTFPGSPRNLKITTPVDLAIAEVLLRCG